MASAIEPLDGFLFCTEEFDPFAERLLIRHLDNVPAHPDEKSNLTHYNALLLMISAFSSKDLLNARKGPNINFFRAVSHQFGSTDTNAAVDALLLVQDEMKYGEPTHQDGHALECPNIRFIHKIFCRVFNNLKKRLWASEARTAARDQTLQLAKDVAKTMVQVDLLRDFTDITTLLDTERMRHALLVKRIANAMIDKNLLRVVPDLFRILDHKTNHTIRNQLSLIRSNISQMSRPRADIYQGAKLEEAIRNIESWDRNEGVATYFNHLEFNTHLTGQAEAVGSNENVLHGWDSDRTYTTSELWTRGHNLLRAP
ncbi:hypothetical protein FHL15_009397 [Xylaria flabelliformis]|uniref:Uncharacterized protein n=1 Tax=Xylaria flabelliformis TaxID=2512241 RepID=A0A553HNY3_9PEZI|nr:hypothetical protein FHL15_009397 [Xylaria flabelliformis]